MAHGISVPTAIADQLAPSALTPLATALEHLSKWTSSLPARSKFYTNKRINLHNVPVLQRAGVKPEHALIANALFDIHSMLTAQCLLKSWRSAQLADGLIAAIGSWNLTAAAQMVRALLETASAWAVESREVIAVWQKMKHTPVRSLQEALSVRNALYVASKQVAWGTRLSQTIAKSEKFRRTNIGTLLRKAEKQCSNPKLLEHYEILCDAVHPSWGAGEVFWAETGEAADLAQMRVLIGTDAIGWLGAADQATKRGSPLPEVLVDAGAWAAEVLAQDLPSFCQVCRDICLAAHIYVLSDLDYWGIVQPTSTYDACACGSGRKTRFCHHEFGRQGS